MNEKDKSKFITAKDLIVIAGLVVFAVFCILTSDNVRSSKLSVEILLKGEVEETIDLSEAGDGRTVVVNNVVVEVSRSGAKIISSTCSDKLCVNSGEINKAGELIYCAPQGVLVRIVGKYSVDAVAF